jgi:hypothetical protein
MRTGHRQQCRSQPVAEGFAVASRSASGEASVSGVLPTNCCRRQSSTNFGSTLGGTMGKGREPQIILKTDQRNVILELGLGWKFRTK